MLTLILAASLGQFMMPTMPAYNPAAYHRQYPEYIFGPPAPPVGNPQLFNWGPYDLVGNVESVDRVNHRFILRTPMERLEVRYTRQTMWVNVGHLEPGVTVSIDQMARSVSFLPHLTLRQIAASTPQFRTGYEDAP